MKPFVGFVLLILLTPIVLIALLTPLPVDDLLAWGAVATFAGWLLSVFRK